MRIVLALLCTALLTVGARAQTLLTEDFSYTAGDPLTSHGWVAHSGAGTNPENVVSPGLTYNGYVSSGVGNAALFTTTGQDVNKTWATYPNGITSGTVYCSILVKLDSAHAAGDYFFHLFKNSSTFTARIFAKKAVNNNIAFGIARSSTASNVAYSDSIYSTGTTYLLVVKYTMVPGATNDTVALWINPNLSQNESAPTVLELASDKTTAEVDTVYGVAIRQGTAANAPAGTIDGIHVTRTWGELNIPLLTIAQARAENNWVPVYSTNHDTIEVTGVVTSPNLGAASSYSSYFVQDATGGVDVYSPTLMNYEVGDSVFVVGTVDQYSGLEEAVPLVGDSLHFGLLKHNATIPTPAHLTLNAFGIAQTAEMYEGQIIEIDSLYKVSGTWPASGSSASIYVSGFGTTTQAQLYVNKNTDVPGTPEHLYPVNIIGVVSQYGTDSTGYEIIPLDTTDIWKTPGLATQYTIAQARVDANNDFVPDFKVSGDTLLICGVVTSPNMGSTYTSYYIQDATAGIDVYKGGTPMTFSIGDSVFVVGTITQSKGMTEISPLAADSAHFGILKHNAVVPKPKLLALHDFLQNSEKYEGSLIEVDSLYKASGTWGSGQNVFVTNLAHSDTTILYINANTDVAKSVEPAYPINLVGVASQYSSSTPANNGYEIIPRDSNDIKTLPPAAPALLTLHGAEYQRADTLVLKWHPSLSATKYLFQLSTSSGFSSVNTPMAVNDSNVTDTTRKVTTLANSTKYFWRVSAYNMGGFGVFSAVDSFITIIGPPETPAIASPADQTTGEPRRETFKWNPSANATKYHLQVASDNAVDSIGGFKALNVVFDTTMVDTVKKLSVALTATTKYYWHVSAIDTGGTSAYTAAVSFTTGVGIDAVNEQGAIPKEFALFQNYPNPFNPSTIISYDLPKSAYVRVVIYDILGQIVATLVDGAQPASHQTVQWNPSGLSSGVYFCRISAQSQDGSGNFTAMKKLLFMK